MEEHLPPTLGDRGSREPLVRHVTQAHPNDLVDPWWMDRVLARDYGEFIYRQWVVDIEDVEPEVIDRSLTDGVRLLRRGTLLNARRIQCVIEGDDAIACIQLGRRMMWAGVAARDLKGAQHLLDALGRSFPEAILAEDEDPHIVLGIWGLQDESRGFRRLEVAPWSDIAANYAATTRESLAPVMDPGFSLEGQGQLLVWFGPPVRRPRRRNSAARGAGRARGHISSTARARTPVPIRRRVDPHRLEPPHCLIKGVIGTVR